MVHLHQMSFFDTVTDEDVLKELKELDVTSMTPIEAMNTLYAMQNRLKNRWSPGTSSDDLAKTLN